MFWVYGWCPIILVVVVDNFCLWFLMDLEAWGGGLQICLLRQIFRVCVDCFGVFRTLDLGNVSVCLFVCFVKCSELIHV